jgi:phenylalanyl-tRNA synthetase beta chain
MKISYQWLKSYVPEIPEPHHLADIFTYHLCEVESIEKLPNGDFIFDLGILPNRAHDLLSHQGIARELSGLLGISFKDPALIYKVQSSAKTKLKIDIKSNSCRRYMGRIVRNITIGPSPEWVKTYLESIGQRSINNVVDATNIIMYDCGQPCHAFDLGKITDCKLQIINAKKGEELKIVGRDGIIAKLKETDAVISSEGKTLALAGVKGGADSGINDATTDILLEVANFDPIAVRKTARRLGLLSDSAKRFENDLSPALGDFAMLELSSLLLEFSPNAQFEEIIDIYPSKQKERTVSFTTEIINRKLGSNITDANIETILKNYCYDFSHTKGIWEIKAPALRLDLNIPEDMVEEIGRIVGYDKVKPTIPKIDFLPEKNETYMKIFSIRSKLVNAGYKEVMTYAFTDKGEVEVLASASDKKFLRTNLSLGLKQSYEMNRLNMPLLGLSEIKIFEIGTIFTKGREEIHVVYADKKGIKEMSLDEFIAFLMKTESEFLRSVRAISENKESNSEEIRGPKNSDSGEIVPFKPWSIYPFITRDIAVWVPEGIDSDKLKSIYHEFGTDLLASEPKLFDQFTQNGKTSYAFHLVFQSFDRTLTDDEVNIIMANISEKIESLGWQIR